MAIALVFWAFLLSACIIVFWRGGSFERGFAALLLVCSALTLALSPAMRVYDERTILFTIDLVIFAAVLVIMHKSTAFWPIWFAGFHATIVATGLAQFVFPNALPGLYVLAAGFWSLPSLLVLVFGTLADHRMRVAGSRIPEARS